MQRKKASTHVRQDFAGGDSGCGCCLIRWICWGIAGSMINVRQWGRCGQSIPFGRARASRPRWIEWIDRPIQIVGVDRRVRRRGNKCGCRTSYRWIDVLAHAGRPSCQHSCFGGSRLHDNGDVTPTSRCLRVEPDTEIRFLSKISVAYRTGTAGQSVGLPEAFEL